MLCELVVLKIQSQSSSSDCASDQALAISVISSAAQQGYHRHLDHKKDQLDLDMKVSLPLTALLATSTTTDAFSPPLTPPSASRHGTSSALQASTNENEFSLETLFRNVGKVVASAAVSAALWGSDLAPFAQQQMMQVQPVQAVEKASGSGSRVNKDPESLLRYGLPIQNKEVRTFIILL